MMHTRDIYFLIYEMRAVKNTNPASIIARKKDTIIFFFKYTRTVFNIFITSVNLNIIFLRFTLVKIYVNLHQFVDR